MNLTTASSVETERTQRRTMTVGLFDLWLAQGGFVQRIQYVVSTSRIGVRRWEAKAVIERAVRRGDEQPLQNARFRLGTRDEWADRRLAVSRSEPVEAANLGRECLGGERIGRRVDSEDITGEVGRHA